MSLQRRACGLLACALATGCAAGVTGGHRPGWAIPPAVSIGTASWMVAGVIAGEPSDRLAATSPPALAAGVVGAVAGAAAGYYLMPDNRDGHGFSIGLPVAGATGGAGLALIAAIRFVRGSGGGPTLAAGSGPKIRRDLYLGSAAGLLAGSGAAIIVGRVRAGRQVYDAAGSGFAARAELGVGPGGVTLSGQF